MRKRAGGTVTNVIIGAFVLYLCISVIYFYARSLDQASTGVFSTTASVSTSISGSTTTTTTNGSITSVVVPDNFSLAQLQTLSFANSSRCDGLLDAKYWDAAGLRLSSKLNGSLVTIKVGVLLLFIVVGLPYVRLVNFQPFFEKGRTASFPRLFLSSSPTPDSGRSLRRLKR